MLIGRTIDPPAHVKSTELLFCKFVECYPQTQHDYNLIGSVPITKRTFAPTNQDEPCHGQSPRLVEVGWAKRVGIIE